MQDAVYLRAGVDDGEPQPWALAVLCVLAKALMTVESMNCTP